MAERQIKDKPPKGGFFVAMKKNNKPIGIIGGMGPFASARMHELLLNIAKKKFGAKAGDGFPEIVLISVPVEEFLNDRKLARKALVILLDRIKGLESHKVGSFGIACNTAHIFTGAIRKSTKIEFVSIIEETVSIVKTKGFKKVGLLASPVTLSSKLYESELREKGLETIVPNPSQTKQLGTIIEELVSNKETVKNRFLLKEIAHSLQVRGAEVIILGCTELPLVFPKRFCIPVINTLEVLANSLLERCYINN